MKPIVNEKIDMELHYEEIIGRLRNFLGLNDDAKVARALNMTPKALGSHRTRGSVPLKQLVPFCKEHEVSLDWLLTGEGPMHRGELAALRKSADSADPGVVTEFPPGGKRGIPGEPAEDDRTGRISGMLTKTAEILESQTIYRTALASNINTFHQALDTETKLEQLARDNLDLRNQLSEIKERLAAVEARRTEGGQEETG